MGYTIVAPNPPAIPAGCQRRLAEFRPWRRCLPPSPKLYAECANPCRNDCTDATGFVSTASDGAFQRGSSSCAKSMSARRCVGFPRPAKWKTMEASIGVNSEYRVLETQ